MCEIEREFLTNIITNNRFYNSVSAPNLKNFPILEKDAVIKNIDNITSNQLENIIKTKTSGSSGKILDVCWNTSDYYNSLSYIWKKRSAYGVYPLDRFCACYSHIYTNYEKPISPRMKIEKNLLLLSKCYMSYDDFEVYYNNILSFKPKMLMFQPTFAYLFGNFLKNRNYVLPKEIRLLELSGEMLTESLLNCLKDLYPKISITNLYGMQEFNGIGYSEGLEFDIINENVIVEILNDEGEIVDNNVEGHIVVTTLTNRAMPLIRYKTNDKGYFFTSNGKIKLCLTKSRSNDIFHYKNLEYDASIFFNIIEDINYSFNNIIRQFRVCKKNTELIFSLLLELSANENILKDFISERLKNIGININVVVKFVDSFNVNNNINNKIKYFIEE